MEGAVGANSQIVMHAINPLLTETMTSQAQICY